MVTHLVRWLQLGMSVVILCLHGLGLLDMELQVILNSLQQGKAVSSSGAISAYPWDLGTKSRMVPMQGEEWSHTC